MGGLRTESVGEDGKPPVLVHCTAGKDRNGVSTAFLLSVERADIEADHLVTNRERERQADFIERTTGYPPVMNHESMLRAAGAPQDAVGDVLDRLHERWGGAVECLRSVGVSDATFAAVRGVFLE